MTLTPNERELQAKQEAGETQYSPGVKVFLCLCMIAVIFSVIIWQVSKDLGHAPGAWPKTLDFRRLIPESEEIRSGATAQGWIESLKVTNNRMLENIEVFESNIEDDSPLIKSLVPLVNLLVTDRLRGSTESVYPGLHDWLFYRPDIDYVTSRGFLDPTLLTARSDADPDLEPNPLPAIAEFRDGLLARGIELVVVPVPAKPCIYPERYTRRSVTSTAAIQNPSYGKFLHELDQREIRYVDLSKILWEAKSKTSQPLYLKNDTHWTPTGMKLAAEAIANIITQIGLVWEEPSESFTHSSIEVANQGDILAMLRLPAGLTEEKKDSVTLEQVRTTDGREWSAEARAEILFLGDSFANIYSLASIGWGGSAGLIEHTSAMLSRSIDRLCINDKGSYATRLALVGYIQRGIDRLAGKKVVIYEFACRELAFGNWKTGFREKMTD
jgi:hypothetical protein